MFGGRKVGRKDLKEPPTAVGGIECSRGAQVGRKDLKEPPTAVGGIKCSGGPQVGRKDLKRTTNCRWWDLDSSPELDLVQTPSLRFFASPE